MVAREVILRLPRGEYIQKIFSITKFLYSSALLGRQKQKPNFALYSYKSNRLEGDTSQLGQSSVVQIINKNAGNIISFFVDVGCNQPKYNNNTYYFEKQSNLHGIAIDPQTDLADKWIEERPNTTFINSATGDKNGESILFVPEAKEGWEDQLATLDGHQNKNLNCSSYAVKVVKLSSVQGIPNNTFFMSIDVEGHELETLRGFDFTKSRPSVVTIENCMKSVGEESIRSI